MVIEWDYYRENDFNIRGTGIQTCVAQALLPVPECNLKDASTGRSACATSVHRGFCFPITR